MPALLPLVWLRRLIWTLALALPLQALAMVSVSGCARLVPSQAGATPAAHHHQGHRLSHQAEAAADGFRAGTGHAAHAVHADQPCSACAAACVGSALLGEFPTVAVMRGTTPLIASAEPASLHVVAAPLDRPPRHLRA